MGVWVQGWHGEGLRAERAAVYVDMDRQWVLTYDVRSSESWKVVDRPPHDISDIDASDIPLELAQWVEAPQVGS